jgi:hypothetical protein
VTPLPYLWLRDNCGCNQCRVTQTSEKKFHLDSVPADLKPESVQLCGDDLHLLWPDGHTTVYAGNNIRALADPPTANWRPWGAGFQPMRADCPDLFRVLCQWPVPFRIFDVDEEAFAVSPTIGLNANGDVTMFRYSNQTMQPMDPTQHGLADFYRAYHEVSRRVMAEESQASFRLCGGASGAARSGSVRTDRTAPPAGRLL